MEIKPTHIILASLVVVPLAFLIYSQGGVPSPSPEIGHWRAFVTVEWTYHWEKSLVVEDTLEIKSIYHTVEWKRMLIAFHLPPLYEIKIGEYNKFKLEYECYDAYGNVVAKGAIEFILEESCKELEAPASIYLTSLLEGTYRLRMEVYQWWDAPLIGKGWTLKDTAEYEFTLTPPT